MDTNGSQFLRLDQCYEDGWGGHEGLEAQRGVDPTGRLYRRLKRVGFPYKFPGI